MTYCVFFHQGDRTDEHHKQIAALTGVSIAAREAGIRCVCMDSMSVKSHLPADATMAFCWGNSGPEKKLQDACAARKIPLVVLELPYFRGLPHYSVSVLTGAGDRMHANGKYLWTYAHDSTRLSDHGISVESMKFRGRMGLLIGQVPGDAQLGGQNWEMLSAIAADKIRIHGYDVLYRPHPLIHPSSTTLLDDMKRCRFAVTWNSTCCVDFIRVGMPFVCLDEGSQYHGLSCALEKIEERDKETREQALSNLIGCQLSTSEICEGKLFSHVKNVLRLRS